MPVDPDQVRERLEAERERTPKLRKREQKKQEELRDLREKLPPHDPRTEAARDRLLRIRKKLAWSIKRRTILRKKLREAKKQALDQPKFEPWMLNGCPQPDAATCLAIARGVVLHDLTCTSTYGDSHSANSRHYMKKAADLASWTTSRMTSFQAAEFADGGQDLYELIGPTNSQIILGGSKTSLAEGGGLENQHDNHVHISPS